MDGECPEPKYDPVINPELTGKTSLEIFDLVLEICGSLGISVMIDIHSAETDLNGHLYPMWYTEKIDEAQYISALAWIAQRHKDNDTVIAYDLKNEPHGKAEEPLTSISFGDSHSVCITDMSEYNLMRMIGYVIVS
jgi:aryl-phospho-beta-D-glucosidase BglC (GH1 family)